jgi:hypothetical protein
MADPDTLAEYVIALLKNDKEEEDLKKHCTKELMDFLKNETESFVQLLFQVLAGNLMTCFHAFSDKNRVFPC